METLRAKRASALRGVRVREAHDRIARQRKISEGGPRWFGNTRVCADPDAPACKRVPCGSGLQRRHRVIGAGFLARTRLDLTPLRNPRS
jgi:hypothetical protein